MVQHRNFGIENQYLKVAIFFWVEQLYLCAYYLFIGCLLSFSSGKKKYKCFTAFIYILYGFYSHLPEWNSRFFVILMEVIKRSKYQGLSNKSIPQAICSAKQSAFPSWQWWWIHIFSFNINASDFYFLFRSKGSKTHTFVCPSIFFSSWFMQALHDLIEILCISLL